ncbi:hypothetical protein [Ascidiaceihabitans sp.]|uniref:hypothetical protein n=1 Tax=Ascidiaceihabitans sp. TaxID=1872644 RepID=UPI003297422A
MAERCPTKHAMQIRPKCGSKKLRKSNAVKASNYTLAKIFDAHRWLWLADSFERYEQNAEELRTGGYNYIGDPEEQYAKKFHPLLRLVLSHEGFHVEHRCEHDHFLQRLADIENTYNVFNRSLDFEVKLGNSLRYVLAKPRNVAAKRNLLSDEQFKHISKTLSSVENWEDNACPHDSAVSFWQILYLAQSEINQNGSISEGSRRGLENLNRVKSNRDRHYGRLVLFILLAEFFDDFSRTEYKTNISEAHIAEDFCPQTSKKIRSRRTFFDSPFARFVSAFYVTANVQRDFEPTKERITAIKKDAWIAASKMSSSPDIIYPIEIKKRTETWLVDTWHEKFAFERGVLKRRAQKRRLRITESLVSGCSASDLKLILTKLEALKPPK